MKQMMLLEITNCINRKAFKFIFTVLTLQSIGSFLLTSYSFYGQNLTFVRSAYETALIQGIYSQPLLFVLLTLLPLLASIIYSDSYYSDLQSGRYKNIITRMDVKKYVWAKAIVIFIVTFGTFFIPLALNQFLSFIAFPLVGYDNNYSLPPYDIGFQNYQEAFLFDRLRIESPLLYNGLYMMIISLFAALFALFAYSLFFYVKKGKFTVIAGVFLSFILLELAVSAFISFKYTIISYVRSGSTGALSGLIFWILILFVTSMVLITAKGSRLEIGIEK